MRSEHKALSEPGKNDEDGRPRGLSGPAKAGAYMGLAFITPAAGYVGFLLGQYAASKTGVSWLDTAGLLLGCAAGMYETGREATRIEGLGRRK